MISFKEIVRGALTRTAPAAFLGFAALVASSPLTRSRVSVTRVGLLVLAALSVAAGSALVLALLRSRLRDDAAVAGRRAVITGLAALALGLTARAFLVFGNPLGDYSLMFASGMLVGGAMFLPWVRTSREPSGIIDAEPSMSSRDSR